MSCGFRRTVCHVQYVDRDDYGGDEDYRKIDLNLAELEGFSGLLCDEQIVEVEIHAEKDHEDSDYPLYVRSIRSKTVIPYAETARTCRAECGTDTVKNGHS